MVRQLKVFIEYCAGWGYDSRFRVLKRHIAFEVPSARVSGDFGRPRSFEVFVDDELVWSKLKNGIFPDPTEIVIAVVKARTAIDLEKNKEERAEQAAKKAHAIKEAEEREAKLEKELLETMKEDEAANEEEEKEKSEETPPENPEVVSKEEKKEDSEKKDDSTTSKHDIKEDEKEADDSESKKQKSDEETEPAEASK